MAKYELWDVLDGLGIESIDYCNESETSIFSKMPRDQLPKGVYAIEGANGLTYYARFPDGRKTEAELQLGLLCHIAQSNAEVRKHTETIKGCIIFFVVIAVIDLVVSFVTIFL